MSRSAADRVADIRDSVARCLRYAPHLDSADEGEAEMAADAVERNIAIIGEAASHLPETVTSRLPEVDWPGIRGMRNVLVHAYFRVDTDIVRDVIETRLRPLDEALATLVLEGG